MSNANITYRPDIDGLRAIAVLLVVLNHVGLTVFSGGFVGVDVFFVISGYLITSIIANQMNKGSFSFTDFYIKRARRILPALYGVLIFVMIFGYYKFLPSDYSVLSQSVISSVAFISNIFFWKNSGGYFSSSAEEMPLLHIWSLSVEEQFYFLWPLALLFLAKLKSKISQAVSISLVIVASTALAEIGISNNWESAYFLLPTRAGELLIGALLAILTLNRKVPERSSATANILALAGLAMILIPSFTLSKTSNFPGINALIPCFGAALIIGSRNLGITVVSQTLSLKPFVFVGLISYSVYLWHWPLISFLHYANIHISIEIAAAVTISSIALGYLSWRFIEQTFRHGAKPFTKGAAIIPATASVALIALSVFIYLKDGLPSRFPYALLTQDELTAERGRYWNGIKSNNTDFDSTKDTKNVVVIGNSHAYDFSYALTENGFKGHIKLIETSFYCFNFSYNYVWAIKAQECKEELSKVLNAPEIKTADIIYLHDNWGGKNLDGLADMMKNIRSLTPAPIFVIGPKMIFKDTALNISKEAQLAKHVTPSSINEFSRQYEDPDRFKYDEELKEFFAKEKFLDVRYVSALDAQCGSSRRCDILSGDGRYLYFDQGHFTLEGSRLFGKHLKEKSEYLF